MIWEEAEDWKDIQDASQPCSLHNGWCGWCGTCRQHSEDLHTEDWDDAD